MAFHFFDFIKPKNGSTAAYEVSCRELFEASRELQIRVLSFHICKNMVAAAVGRAEVRTYVKNEETRGLEYYLWNVSPNVNESSTVFLHKLIDRLFTGNEALVIETRPRGELSSLVVADSFLPGRHYPAKQNEYTSVQVGDQSYDKTFRENDVIHLKLNHCDIKPVLDGITAAYGKVQAAAMDAYEWRNGKHVKVHVNQLASGQDGFQTGFAQMLKEQVKPFFEAGNTILPEFDGYSYSDFETGAAASASAASDLRALTEDIFNFTAQAFLIPIVLTNGKVEQTADANTRFLTNVIDPICDQLQEEINRKRYSLDDFLAGSGVMVDTSSIIHFDIFGNAANVEKVVGSGVFTINDVRRAAGLAPINEPWANMHFLTKNIGTVSDSASAIG